MRDWYVESSELRAASLTSMLETRLSTCFSLLAKAKGKLVKGGVVVMPMLWRGEGARHAGKERAKWHQPRLSTFEIAESRVGLGAVFLEPKRRFILARCVAWKAPGTAAGFGWEAVVRLSVYCDEVLAGRPVK